jgi:hypothetical protein
MKTAPLQSWVREATRLAVATLLAASWASAALAQGEPKYAGWSKVENAREMRDYREKLRDGGAIDAESRRFIEQTVLPQLTLEENRKTIERTRRRMREVLMTDIDDEKVFADLSSLVRDTMLKFVRSDDIEPPMRVNAVLLIGELRGRDGKPWPQAQPMLAAVAGDAKLPIAVRIAALASISRHQEAFKADAQATATLAKAAGPAIAAIIAAPRPADAGPEQDWLVSRALSLVPTLLPAPPKATSAALAAIVEEAARPIDVRVRAVAALGATADATAQVNAGKVFETIRGLAIQALEADIAAAEKRKFELQYRQLTTGQQSFMQPGMPPGMAMPGGIMPDGGIAPAAPDAGIPEQACRRNAWRLVTLADAIDPGVDRKGLAALLGPGAAAAKQFAATLRDSGMAIDQTPDEQAVAAALAAIDPRAAAPAPSKPQAPAAEPEPKPADAPAADPNASPFDNPF